MRIRLYAAPAVNMVKGLKQRKLSDQLDSRLVFALNYSLNVYSGGLTYFILAQHVNLPLYISQF